MLAEAQALAATYTVALGQGVLAAARLALVVALFPLTHFLLPLVALVFAVVKHTILVPLLLIVRTGLYGFVYVPLVPVLAAAGVPYDSTVAVEVALYRLFVASVPRVSDFLFHAVHFFMVSVYVGSFVGAVAGVNLFLVSKVLHLPDPPKPTMPFVDRYAQQLATLELPPADENPIPANEPRIKQEPVSDVSVAARVPSAPSFNPIVRDYTYPNPSLFEDDDGYSYAPFHMTKPEPSVLPSAAPEQTSSDDLVPRKVPRRKSASSVHTIVEEDLELEASPTPSLVSAFRHKSDSENSLSPVSSITTGSVFSLGGVNAHSSASPSSQSKKRSSMESQKGFGSGKG